MNKLIIARFFIKPENIEDFKLATIDVIEGTRREVGNIFYYLYQSVENPTEFVFYEKFEDEQSFDFHVNTEHYKNFERVFTEIQSINPELNILS